MKMRRRYWIYMFFLFGLYGIIGEIVDILISNISRGKSLWFYYNGMSISWELFILFGFAGCLAFYFYKLIRKTRIKSYNANILNISQNFSEFQVSRSKRIEEEIIEVFKSFMILKRD